MPGIEHRPPWYEPQEISPTMTLPQSTANEINLKAKSKSVTASQRSAVQYAELVGTPPTNFCTLNKKPPQ